MGSPSPGFPSVTSSESLDWMAGHYKNLSRENCLNPIFHLNYGMVIEGLSIGDNDTETQHQVRQGVKVAKV